MRISRRTSRLLMVYAITIYFATWLMLTVWRDEDEEYSSVDKFTVDQIFLDDRSAIHGPRQSLPDKDKVFPKEKNSSLIRQDNETGLSNCTKTKPLYSEEIINPHPFQFTIRNPKACLKAVKERGMPLRLLILVKTRPKDTLDRQQIRRTWGGSQNISNQLTLTMFLLGQPVNTSVTKEDVWEESRQYGDIVQEDFKEAYSNLTFKNMMGLKWAAAYCPMASFIASVDSDIILNLQNLLQRLKDQPRQRFAMGSLKTNWTPYRDAHGEYKKWYTSVELYPEPTYPPFFPGGCYVMSSDVGAAIFRESVHVRFLPWDDVFVGLVLKRIGVTPVHGDGFQVYVPLTRRVLIRSALIKNIAVIGKHHTKSVDRRLILIYQRVMQKYTFHKPVQNTSEAFPRLRVFLIAFVLLCVLAYFVVYFILLVHSAGLVVSGPTPNFLK